MSDENPHAPIRHDVLVHCSRCCREVWAVRTVYPDISYFHCKPANHHWEVGKLDRALGRTDEWKPPKGD